MSRHHLALELQVELLRRQFLQLQDPRQLPIPAGNALKMPDAQASIYKTMFREDCTPYPPPLRYRLRVLKRIVDSIERAFVDPEEDELSDDLSATLAALMAAPDTPYTIAAQQKHYVTYVLPTCPLSTIALPLTSDVQQSSATTPSAITLLESQDVLASAGTTGRRTWEAALHLGTLLLQEDWRSLFDGATILELGAGTGFISILCARYLHAQFVLATDGSGDVVDDLERNYFLNGIEGSAAAKAAVLKWGHSLIEEVLDVGMDERGRRSYDFVLGSDLIYDPDAVRPLVMTLLQLTKRHPSIRAIISATVRNEQTLKLFEDTCINEGLQLDLLRTSPSHPRNQQGFFHSISMPIRTYAIARDGMGGHHYISSSQF